MTSIKLFHLLQQMPRDPAYCNCARLRDKAPLLLLCNNHLQPSGFVRIEIGIMFYKLCAGLIEQTKEIMPHQDLSITMYSRADSDGWNMQSSA